MSYTEDSDSVSASDDEAGPRAGPQAPAGAASGGPGGLSESAQHADRDAGAAAAVGGAPQPGVPAAAAAAAAAADREAETALLAGELSRDAALLQLQVNELLAAVRPPPLKPAVLAGVLAQLRAALAAIKPQEVPGTRLPGLIAGLGLDPAAVSLPFEPPAAVEAVGSLVLGVAPQSARPVLDVAVVMPGACLHRKDHINYRYQARRALYLATLARALAAQPAFSQQALEALHGDAARPVLLVHLASPALTLRLMPVPPVDAFPLHKLAPDRNNVRWVTRPGAPESGAAQQPAQQQPAQQQQEQPAEGQPAKPGLSGQPPEWLATPAYNAAIAQDATTLASGAALAARMQASAPMRDALLLLKVWAVQAGLAAASGGAGGDDGQAAASPGSMSGHLLAAVLLCAAEATGPPAAAMSALQLFRAALALLADAAAWSRGVALGRPRGKKQQQQQQNGAAAQQGQAPPPLAVFRKAYPVVLLDAGGWTNLAAGVSQSLLAQAQLLARRTLAVLDHPADAEAAFAAAFLQRLRPAALFDYLWAVSLPEPGDGAQPPPGDADRARQDEALVEGLVRKALTTRALLVRALPRAPAFPGTAAGSVLAALAAGACVPASSPVLVGAVVDANEALRVVDVGPAADDAAAAARFRALWGERSELRRFQDGRICEAVVWEAPRDARHTVPDAAVAALLRRHLPQGACVSCSASRLDGALDTAAAGGGAAAPLGAAAAARAVDAALDKLARQLRGLGELVLKVVGVQPLSAVARHTAPFVPEPHPLVGGPGGLAAAAGAAHLPRCLDALEVMVSLEGSGRWPDDPAAYAKMKAAVGCQLAAALAAAAGFTVSPSEEAVDVFVDGFAFRLLLFTDRDAAMHAKVVAAGPHAHHHHAEAHSPPHALLLSWHHGLIAGLEGQHAAFGPTCRLAKRWLGCQLMGSQLAGEAVELIVAAAFCGPAPAPPPASRITGLLRFLQLLATHPWQRAPLLVDPAREVGEAARRALLAEYEARRAVGAAPAMFISTPRDTHSSRWTMERPGAGVVAHLAATAAAAAALLARLQERDAAAAEGWGALFEAPLADFDAWLLLRRDALPSADRALPGAASRLSKHLERAAPSAAASRKRGRSGAGGGDAPAEKAARAVLRAFPSRVLASQPTASLVPELLVGFEPVGRYVAALSERFGHIADFCADPAGGFPAVGVRWRPAAFVPTPLRPATAHAVVEVAPGLVLPNLPQALAEMELLGQGLVAQAVAL